VTARDAAYRAALWAGDTAETVLAAVTEPLITAAVWLRWPSLRRDKETP